MNVVAVLAGPLCWSLLEYVLHRFNGHEMRGRTRFSREHLAHHADPAYFAPTAYKLAAAVPVVGVMAALTVPALGPTGLLFTGSFAVAYAGYEVLHRRLHTHAPRGAYGRWARRHHLIHHHLDPRANHGVTSPLWDWVFGTLRTCDGAVRVPPRQVPSWLLDPATGAVRAAYQQDYTVPVRRQRAS